METGIEPLSRSPYCGSWMVSLTLARRPAVHGGRVARRQQRRAGEQFLAQGAGAVVALVDAAILQDRHDQAKPWSSAHCAFAFTASNASAGSGPYTHDGL